MTKKVKQRRPNNQGSVFQRKNGRFVGYVNLGTDENGKMKRRYVYGHSKEEVERKIVKLTGRLSSLKIDSIQRSMAELMKEWVLVFKQSDVTSRTFANYILYFKKYIEPHIQIEITDVDIVILKKILINVFTETHSTEVVRKVKTLLTQFYDYAVEEKLAEYNPVRSIKTKFGKKKDDEKDKKKEYKAITIDHRTQFLNALSKNQFLLTLCSVGLYIGLRIGEILALKWKDVDFENATLNIDKAITITFQFDDNGERISKTTIVSDPKTSCSVAILPIPNKLLEILRLWYNLQKEKSEKVGVNLVDKNAFVFANDDGTVRTYYGTKAIYYRFLRNNKLDNKEFHFHALRHTFGTMLKDNAEDLYKIQMLLRHASAKTTERYLSIDKRRAVNLQSNIDNAIEKINAETEKLEKQNSQKVD